MKNAVDLSDDKRCRGLFRNGLSLARQEELELYKMMNSALVLVGGRVLHGEAEDCCCQSEDWMFSSDS